MGQSPSSKNYSENSNDTILIQGNADLDNGKVIPRVYTSEITKTSAPNDIILTVRAPVGKLAINSFFACIGRGVCSIKGDKFTYYYLESLNENNTWEKLSQGSTFEAINSGDIKNLLIKIPEPKDQEKISNFLFQIDKKITLLNKQLDCCNNFKDFCLQNLFSKNKLRFIKRYNFDAKYVSDYLKESKIKASNDDINKHLTVKLNLKGVIPRESKTIEKEGATTQYIRKSGQFIYGKQNLYKGALGLIPKELDNFLSSSDIPSFDFINSVNHLWFYYYFSRKSFYESLEKYSTGTGSKRISPTDFLKIKLFIPPLEIQEKIANFLLLIDKKIDLTQNQITEMEKFKKGLLQQMFVYLCIFFNRFISLF